MTRRSVLATTGLATLALSACMSHKAPAPAGAQAPAAPQPAAPAAPPPVPAAVKHSGPHAVAVLEPRGGSKVKGRAEFSEADGKVTLVLTVTGLTPGEHAFHLHEKGDCSAPDATSAGGHWNPTSEAHGKWGAHPFHRGDVANLVAGADGRATLTFSTDLWSIGGDASRDVIGRALIVHAKADDFTTQPTGGAGGRVACGVVAAD